MAASQQLPPEIIAQIRELFHKNGMSKSQISKQLSISKDSVSKYVRVSSDHPPVMVKSDTTTGEAFTKPVELPESEKYDFTPVHLDGAGCWWIISDIHIPFHNKAALEIGLAEAKRRGIVGIILNGDIIDCLGLSSKFHRRPDEHTFRMERDYAVQFLQWLRQSFPKIPIIYKEGNHEYRLTDFLIQKAKELFDIPELTLEALLQFEEFGVTGVKDKRLIYLGELPILHGHELPHGISAPVNAARGAFLRAIHTVMVSHHHTTSEHHERDITGKPIVTWSIGCNCTLNPRYSPYNKWNHGGAFVNLSNDSRFTVQNYRIIEGVLR